MATPFLAGRSLRAAATIATGTGLLVSSRLDDEYQEGAGPRLLNAHTTSCEPQQRLASIEHTPTRSTSIPSWKNELMSLDIHSQPWVACNEATLPVRIDKETPDMVVPTAAWRTELPPAGLNAQPWFDDSESIIQHPNSLFSPSLTSCDEPVEQNDTPVTSTELATTTKTVTIPEWKKQLSSPELHISPYIEREEIVTKTIESLGTRQKEVDHVTEVFLIGALHNTRKSAQNTELLLKEVDPDAIAIELCKEREALLHLDPDLVKNISFPLIPLVTSIYDQGLSFNHSVILFTAECMQYLLAKTGSGYGGEFRTAYEHMKEIDASCSFLLLADRPFSLSLARMTDIDKISNSSNVVDHVDLYGSEPPRPIRLEELKSQSDATWNKAWKEQESWSDFIRHGIIDNEALIESWTYYEDIQFPLGTDMHVLLQERDIYMVCKLIQFCQAVKPKRVVFVVGAKHVRGMAHLLRRGVIGSTIKPEEVLPQLLASKEYPIEDPKVQAEVSNLWHARKPRLEE